MSFKFRGRLLAFLGSLLCLDSAVGTTADPCAAIAGLEWVTPAALRACFQYISCSFLNALSVMVNLGSNR